jgi:hypothetical protein
MKKLAIGAFMVLVIMLLANTALFAQMPDYGTITGTVYAEDSNEPLAHAVVMAFFANENRPPAAYARTDESGAYELNLPYGTYVVQANAMGFLPEFWQEVDNRDDAAMLIVDEIHNPAGIDFTLAEMSNTFGSIAGTVFENNSEDPIGGARITLYREDNGHYHRTVFSGNDGAYLFDNLPPGSYHLECYKEGYLLAIYPENVAVNGDDITGIDFYIEPLVFGSIAGTVYDDATGEPLSGVHVTSRLSGEYPFVREAISGNDGTYIIDQLIPGDYNLTACKRDYVPQDYAEPVTVDGDDITGIDFNLQPIVVAGISGVVTVYGSNEPIEHALVCAINSNHPFHWRWAITNEAGEYEIELLSGEYMVQAWAWGYLAVATTEPIVVEDEVVTGIDFELLPLDFGSISGTVYNADGEPIAGALVDAGMVNGHFHKRVRTDENGNYMFDQVLPGSYLMRAFAYGYNPQALEEPVMVENGANVTGVDFHLDPFEWPYNGIISGYVTDEDTEEPIADAVLIAFGQGPCRTMHAQTDENGYYIFEHLPTSEFRLLCLANDYQPELYDDKIDWREADPVTPDAENVNFALAAPEDGPRILGGRITEQGMPVSGAIVIAMLDGEVNAVTATYPDGYYSFDAIAPGDYTVMTISPDENEGSIEVSAVYEDVYDADIVLSPISVDDNDALPVATILYQNFPNPFNATTNINFYLANDGHAELAIYDLLGRKVVELASDNLTAGSHTFIWNGQDSKGKQVSSGMYLYILKTTGRTFSDRMVLLK